MAGAGTGASARGPSGSALAARERDFVLAQRVARLATTNAAGECFAVPVCYAWDGRCFYTPIDEKPKRPGRVLTRVRNIAATGRATLIVDRYDDADWSRLAWVMVRGSAEVIDTTDPRHAPAVALLRHRYRQYQAMALESAPIIAITPERVSSWGALELEET